MVLNVKNGLLRVVGVQENPEMLGRNFTFTTVVACTGPTLSLYDTRRHSPAETTHRGHTRTPLFRAHKGG